MCVRTHFAMALGFMLLAQVPEASASCWYEGIAGFWRQTSGGATRTAWQFKITRDGFDTKEGIVTCYGNCRYQGLGEPKSFRLDPVNVRVFFTEKAESYYCERSGSSLVLGQGAVAFQKTTADEWNASSGLGDVFAEIERKATQQHKRVLAQAKDCVALGIIGQVLRPIYSEKGPRIRFHKDGSISTSGWLVDNWYTKVNPLLGRFETPVRWYREGAHLFVVGDRGGTRRINGCLSEVYPHEFTLEGPKKALVLLSDEVWKPYPGQWPFYVSE